MTRITPVESQNAGWFARFTYWYAARMFGKAPGSLRVLAQHAGILRANAGYEFWSSRARTVDEKLKLLAELRVATMVGCRFCIDIGSSIARGHGVEARQLLELDDYAKSDAFTPVERTVLEYASAMSSERCEVSDELFARLRGYFDERQLVELTAAIAWENQRARFNHALRIPPDGFSQGAVCALPSARLGEAAASSH